MNMKKLFPIVAAILLLAACKPENSEAYKNLLSANDSLAQVNSTQEKALNDYLQVINEINANFASISEKHTAIQQDKELKNNKEATTRIQENMRNIMQMLVQNKEKIAELNRLNQAQASKNAKQAAEFEKTISRLSAELEEKTNMVISMQKQLDEKDIQIFELDKAYGTAMQENTEMRETVSQITEELNAGYYVFGTIKELKAQRIVSKSNIFTPTKVLQGDFNQSYFVKINTKTTVEIPVFSKKAKVLTKHPLTSYEIATVNASKVIRIKNPEAFWGVSKYLVVETNN
jgi:predicted RNase H-like nuclease (RuvC/YqgF family)